MPESFTTPYTDRREAGRKLAQSLLRFQRRADVVVLAVSPGGVLVGDGIAGVLGVPLDVFFIRKVGVPGYEGLSMGSVARAAYLPDQRVLTNAGISLRAFVESAKAEQETLDRLEAFYEGGRPAQVITGRTVILVDEGIADESDVPHAIEALHRHGAGSIVLAAPVATAAAQKKLTTPSVAEVVCSYTIDAATSLEGWYLDSTPVDDDTIRATLLQAAERLRELQR